MMGRVARVVAIAMGLAILAGVTVGGGGARPSWDDCTARAGDVRFRAQDGTRVVGHVFGRGPKAVVLAHQSPGNLCQWLAFAKRLSRSGYRALVFDFRNSGGSQKRSSPKRRYAFDIVAGGKFLRARGAQKVFFMGASFGASAAITAAELARPQVDGVVSVSGEADLAGAIDSAKRLKAPVLFVVGRLDKRLGTDYPAEAQRLYDAAASPDKTLKILERGEHGTDLVGSSPAARRLIDGFLASH
jgi:pimeloyl-ACP methyl ester carboxylesterase